ncbi:MAG: transposase [Desulfovibrio sp.]|nr:transposase [Desulfovibrio sp.]
MQGLPREKLRDSCARSLEKKWSRLAVFRDNSESEVLAYRDFPQNHWAKIYSTNPLERLNKEVKRRSAVGGHLSL